MVLMVDFLPIGRAFAWLALPLKVGIAFVPDELAGNQDLTERDKMELMKDVARHFQKYEFVKSLELIPSAYLRARGGFTNSSKGFKEASQDLVANLDSHLGSLRELIKTSPAQYQIVYQPGYTGGGSLDGFDIILCGILGAMRLWRNSSRTGTHRGDGMNRIGTALLLWQKSLVLVVLLLAMGGCGGDSYGDSCAIATSALPDGSVGVPYRAALTSDCGHGLWSADPSKLPPGIHLSEDGVLSGVPTLPGVYQFTVGDIELDYGIPDLRSDTRDFTITIHDAS